MKKKCNCCQEVKAVDEFYVRNNVCKVCQNKRAREWRERNKEYLKEYDKQRYQNNAEAIKERINNYRKQNPEKVLDRQRAYRERNRKILAEKSREYAKQNPDVAKQYYHERYKIDVNYRMARLLRSRINKVINRNSRTSPSLELLGCTIEEVKQHIEGQFQKGMTWDDWSYDGWHLDHIRPCASFDLTDPEQQKDCFHYTNLQPLWAEDNISKGASI